MVALNEPTGLTQINPCITMCYIDEFVRTVNLDNVSECKRRKTSHLNVPFHPAQPTLARWAGLFYESMTAWAFFASAARFLRSISATVPATIRSVCVPPWRLTYPFRVCATDSGNRADTVRVVDCVGASLLIVQPTKMSYSIGRLYYSPILA